MFVTDPVELWFDKCEKSYDPKTNYSALFLNEFEKSYFFEFCKSELNGIFTWYDWQRCSQSCSSDETCGTQLRIAKSCEPSYAICSQIQVEERACGCKKCLYNEAQFLTVQIPIGSIIPWVPKPSSAVSNEVKFDEWQGWIKKRIFSVEFRCLVPKL